jgi:hypothetical protein
MQIFKNNNGFPYAWKAGRVEQLIRSILETKAQEQLAVNRVMIINPTWLHEDNILENIKETNPDFIICHNFVDPAISKILEAVEQSKVPYIIIGSAEHFRLDYWAMVCDLYFQHYEPEDVVLEDSARKYICLNRKPHPHRQVIVNRLIESDLQSEGFVSLGTPGNPITIDEIFENDQGINDEYGNVGVDESIVSKKILNDIFSLGNIKIWNNSFLCLVTETVFDNANPNNFFISEKTWKPIIGCRPFFVYGQEPLRQYLKDSGFDIFEDIFDYSQEPAGISDEVRQKHYAQIAIDAINRVQNPAEEYKQYAGRCWENKKRFHAYVYEQWDKLHKLDLSKYLNL